MIRMGLVGIVGGSAFKDRDQGHIKCLVVDRALHFWISHTCVQADQAIGAGQQSVAVVDQRLAIFGRVIFEGEKYAVRHRSGSLGHGLFFGTEVD